MLRCTERRCSRKSDDVCRFCNKALCEDHIYPYIPRIGLSSTFFVATPAGTRPSRKAIADAEREYDRLEDEAIARWSKRIMSRGYNPAEWGTPKSFDFSDNDGVGWPFCYVCYSRLTKVDSESTEVVARPTPDTVDKTKYYLNNAQDRSYHRPNCSSLQHFLHPVDPDWAMKFFEPCPVCLPDPDLSSTPSKVINSIDSIPSTGLFLNKPLDGQYHYPNCRRLSSTRHPVEPNWAQKLYEPCPLCIGLDHARYRSPDPSISANLESSTALGNLRKSQIQESELSKEKTYWLDNSTSIYHEINCPDAGYSQKRIDRKTAEKSHSPCQCCILHLRGPLPKHASGSNGCFVATATFGPDNPTLKKLRQFRDERLCKSSAGRQLIRIYQVVGPLAARGVDRYPASKRYIAPVLATVADVLSKRQSEGG